MVKKIHSEEWKQRKKMNMIGNTYGLGYKFTKQQSIDMAQRQMKKDQSKVYLLDDDIMIGLMLSDAHLIKPKTQFQNTRFTLSASIKYKGLIDYLEQFFNENGISSTHKTFKRELGTSINFTTTVNPVFTEMRKIWYNDKTKIVPNDLKLTEKSVAWWFMGDGSSNWQSDRKNTVRAEFCTESFTYEENLHLQKLLDDIGLSGSYLGKYNKGYRIYYKRKEAVLHLMNTIEPYMIPTFMYKIKKHTL